MYKIRCVKGWDIRPPPHTLATVFICLHLQRVHVDDLKSAFLIPRYIGQTTVSSAAVFGLFLGAGSLLHCGRSQGY